MRRPLFPISRVTPSCRSLGVVVRSTWASGRPQSPFHWPSLWLGHFCVSMTTLHVALLSRIHSEMFFRLWAETFGPFPERVFQCAVDEGCSI